MLLFRRWWIRLVPVIVVLAALGRPQRVACQECPGFSAPVDYAVGAGTFNVAAGDFNRDGRRDLAVTVAAGVKVLLGDGSGTFQAGGTYAAGTGPTALVVGDFNRDGKPDIAVAN